MELAKSEDGIVLEEIFGDIITNYENKILNNQLYFSRDETGEIICLGAIEPMILSENKACIAMKVVASKRGKGYGVKIVQFLVQELHQKKYKVNARCWVKNEASKATLLKAGFNISNMLVKVEDMKEVKEK